LSKSEQDAAVERVVHTDELTVRDRAAAILVIVFGQHIEDVIRLTWDDVTVTDELVTIRLGKTEFALPSPLDEPMRELAAAPGHDLTAAHPTSNWVFRGYSPGRHIHGSSLRGRLKSVFSTRAARLGTLHELTKLGPVPIIADALGYHPSTIERHAIGSASTHAQYIAAARDQRMSS
jgi:integrase